ncbi:MAG: hypothetical protein Q9219_006668 [cf. Caloplaca sp. 3 TL-2023]
MFRSERQDLQTWKLFLLKTVLQHTDVVSRGSTDPAPVFDAPPLKLVTTDSQSSLTEHGRQERSHSQACLTNPVQLERRVSRMWLDRELVEKRYTGRTKAQKENNKAQEEVNKAQGEMEVTKQDLEVCQARYGSFTAELEARKELVDEDWKSSQQDLEENQSLLHSHLRLRRNTSRSCAKISKSPRRIGLLVLEERDATPVDLMQMDEHTHDIDGMQMDAGRASSDATELEAFKRDVLECTEVAPPASTPKSDFQVSVKNGRNQVRSAAAGQWSVKATLILGNDAVQRLVEGHWQLRRILSSKDDWKPTVSCIYAGSSARTDVVRASAFAKTFREQGGTCVKLVVADEFLDAGSVLEFLDRYLKLDDEARLIQRWQIIKTLYRRRPIKPHRNVPMDAAGGTETNAAPDSTAPDGHDPTFDNGTLLSPDSQPSPPLAAAEANHNGFSDHGDALPQMHDERQSQIQEGVEVMFEYLLHYMRFYASTGEPSAEETVEALANLPGLSRYASTPLVKILAEKVVIALLACAL